MTGIAKTGGTLAGRSVMVVDDEPHLTQVLAFNLRRAGAEVTTARDGAEALAAVRQQVTAGRRPDLLITDYQMPVMNGSDLCRALRERPGDGGDPDPDADRPRAQAVPV